MDLLQEDVSNPMDAEVPAALLLGAVLPALFHGAEEAPVEVAELVQAGEDPIHSVVVQLQLLLHALPEDLRHDGQGVHVVHLRLHQLCGDQAGFTSAPTFTT